MAATDGPPQPTVAVLGAGVMARAMIPRLRDAGFRMRLFNRTASNLDSIVGPGDVLCGSPAEAAESADIVLSVVVDDRASSHVWMAADGAFRTLRPDAFAVECSTLSASYVAAWAATGRNRGGRPVDAPMTGSKQRAEQGDLVFFVGADEHDLRSLHWFFDPIAGDVRHFGPPGSGTAYKLIHNLIAATALTGLAEALALGEVRGLDMKQVLDTLSTYGWGAHVAQSKGRAMTSDSFDDVMCSVQNLAKDTSYAVQMAVAAGLRLPVADRVEQQLFTAVLNGDGELDMAVVRRVYEADVAGRRSREATR